MGVGVGVMSCFNPTLVRLRLARVWALQFHPWWGFQSHAGSIEAAPGFKLESLREAGFNPTLVRLRPVTIHPIEEANDEFQSHAG